MYFCLIKILSFDDKGNLEYNIQSNVSQYLFLPTFINEEFEEIILLISDENKWYSVYLNLGQKKGQVIDFKNGEKVSMEQILQILEEIIQREFKIEINLFDFNVIFNSLQIDNDMGYFFINFYYKYIHGQQIDQIRFNFKEKDILKQRCEQIIFKLKEIEDAK